MLESDIVSIVLSLQRIGHAVGNIDKEYSRDSRFYYQTGDGNIAKNIPEILGFEAVDCVTQSRNVETLLDNVIN